MRKRCPSAKLLGIGILPRYSLVFNRWGDYRPGGVSSVEPADSPESKVYGTLWNLSSQDLSSLDETEVPTSYKRTTIDIELLDSPTPISSYIYIAIPQPGPIPPDKKYLELIIDAATEMRLPKSYIESLKKFRHDSI